MPKDPYVTKTSRFADFLYTMDSDDGRKIRRFCFPPQLGMKIRGKGEWYEIIEIQGTHCIGRWVPNPHPFK